MPKLKKTTSVRLASHIIPERYTIKIKPDLEKFTFEGEEEILIELLTVEKNITIHSQELDIESAEVIYNEEKLFASKIIYNEKAETATFVFKKNIPKGKIKLHLVFRGILNDKLKGFYRSQYEIDGKKHHMATTQFESTDARRAFPCFDEPALKAVFDVTLLIPKHTIAISNTLPISEIENENFREVTFAPTPKMSTYLLAFIVGQFEYLEKKTKGGVLVRVYTTPGKKNQAAFALDFGLKTLEFYEKYFDIKYPLKTLDMIAIPDFSAGAMENWGAITYRESRLLIDEKHSSLIDKKNVALVIAHELAHQWFGNLVTMEWWTHLWLNEGFASYIEYLAVDKINPGWNIWEDFSTYEQGRALSLDALKNTHPIEIPVHHPAEIAEIFDEVSYSKGASVILMIANYLGEKDFRDGLRYYLKKHSYKNTSTIHLWQAFEKISGKPVTKMMKNWTNTAGYPIVQVKKVNGKIITIQKRFFINENSEKESKDTTKWMLPLKIKEKPFFTINQNAGGFFITSYSEPLLEQWKNALVQNKVPLLDRAGFLRDCFHLNQRGFMNTESFLSILKAYENESEYTVWIEIAGCLSSINNLLTDKNTKEKYRVFAEKMTKMIMSKIGFMPKKGEKPEINLLRAILISTTGKFGNQEIIEKSQKLFTDTINKKTSITPDLRSSIYGIVARNGGEKEYKIFLDIYRKESLHQEKNRIGYTLGLFQNPKLVEKTLHFSLSKEVRKQDSIAILAYTLNPVNKEIAWEFIKNNWPVLKERYGSIGNPLSNLIKSLAVFNTQEKYNDIKKFFKKNPTPSSARAIEQTLEKIDANIIWIQRENKNIASFLDKNAML